MLQLTFIDKECRKKRNEDFSVWAEQLCAVANLFGLPWLIPG